MANEDRGRTNELTWQSVVLSLAVITVLAISGYRAAASGWQLNAWQGFAELCLLSIGLVSLRLVHRQISAQTAQTKKDLDWKQINSFFEFFHSVPDNEVNGKLHKLAQDHSIADAFSEKPRPLTGQELAGLLAKEEDVVTVRTYLDAWESFAGAVRCGLVGEDFAYRMECGRVMRTFTIFEPYIQHVQERVNPRAYIELTLLAEAWSDKREEDVKQQRAGNGVKPNTLGH